MFAFLTFFFPCVGLVVGTIAGPLDFRCVQTYMGMMNKTWFGICLIRNERERERDGVYAILKI